MTLGKLMQGKLRPVIATAPVLVSGLLLSGCLGGPTYGTGTPSNVQLMEDVTSMFSLAPKNDEKIEYKPRPELVQPASTASLPAPQQDIAAASNPSWPESPEQRRARLRAEATENQDNPFYEPKIRSGEQGSRGIVSAARIGERGNFETAANTGAQRAEFNRRMAEANQGSPKTRKYLSEPPLTYRQPSETAAAGDVGEDEWKKEARRKREAREKAGKSRWYDALPGFQNLTN